MLVMAIASGVAAASIYINQPLLGMLERDFPGHLALVRLVSTATQLGYALGLVLLVPLGDIIERRRLVLGQLVVLAGALGLAAMAPGAATLLAASLLVGGSASLAQQVVPFAAELSEPGRRGKTVGTVMSGLLTGILLGRVVSGIVGHHAGWRAVFELQMGLVLVTFVLLALALPRRPPALQVTYGALLASLVDLWRHEPALRAATITQAALFASFIAFWTVLTLELDRAYGLGAQAAGLFGLVGAAGVLFAPAAGHSADRRGPRLVIRASTIMMLAAWLVFGLTGGIVWLVLGVVLLDLGEQGALISHQQIIYALHSDARGRLNTILMGGMFIGSTLGSAVAVFAWDHGGWRAVCAFGACLCVVAMLGQRRTAGRIAPAAPQG